jgi:hypothetical protein
MSILEDVVGRSTYLERPDEPLVPDAHDNRIDSALPGLVHNRLAGFACLEQFSGYLAASARRDLLGLAKELLSTPRISLHLGIQWE